MKYPIVVCDNCKEEFEWEHSYSNYKISKHHFCDRACYYKWRKEEKNTPNWKGGKVEMLGYIFLRTLGHPYGNEFGYVKRSRLIMEKCLGRYLDPEETIHHINGDREDDRIENLMLFPSKSDHQKHHWKLRKQSKTQEQLVWIQI